MYNLIGYSKFIQKEQEACGIINKGTEGNINYFIKDSKYFDIKQVLQEN